MRVRISSFKTWDLRQSPRITFYYHFNRIECGVVIDWNEYPVLVNIGFLFWSIDFELSKRDKSRDAERFAELEKKINQTLAEDGMGPLSTADEILEKGYITRP